MRKIKQILYAVLLAALIISCDKPETIGPNIVGLYGPVTVTQAFSASLASPNFGTGDKVYFNAGFENDVAWTITLVGQTTGAVKTITGIGKSINASNSTWNGSSDGAPSFTTENVTATLSFQNVTNTYTTSITINGTRDSDVGGVLVSNFAVSKVSGPGSTTGWPSDWPTTVVTDNSYIKPDGNNYLLMSGTPWQANSPYVDFMTIPAKDADVNYGTYYPLYADPSKVYFNIMVYNTGTSDTWLQIAFFEEGVVARTLAIRPDWVGWKQISVNYTKLTASTVGASIKPNKLTAIQFVLLSDSKTLPGAAVSTAFDHVIFTHNAPYQP